MVVVIQGILRFQQVVNIYKPYVVSDRFSKKCVDSFAKKKLKIYIRKQ